MNLLHRLGFYRRKEYDAVVQSNNLKISEKENHIKELTNEISVKDDRIKYLNNVIRQYLNTGDWDKPNILNIYPKVNYSKGYSDPNVYTIYIEPKICSFSIVGDYKYIKDPNWLDCILRQYSIQSAVNFTDMFEEQIYSQLKEIHKEKEV
jgi:hypothetical protein